MKNINKKIWTRIWYGILVVLLIFVLTRLDLRGTWDSIIQIPLWTLAILTGLQAITQLLVNMQWYQVARFSDVHIPFSEMLLINCQGAVVDSITPGVKVGGEVTRAVQIRRKADCSGESAAAVVAVQKLFSLSSFFFISLFAFRFVISGFLAEQTRGFHFIIYGILILFTLLLASIFFFPHKILAYLRHRENTNSEKNPNPEDSSGAVRRETKRSSKSKKVRGFAQNTLEGLILFRRNGKAWIAQIALSLLIWLLYPAKMYILSMHFSPDAGFLFLGAVTFVAYLVAMIPLFPGGLGGFEATMAGLLLAGGFTQGDALAIAVIFRFFTFWFVMLFSLGFIGFYKLTIGRLSAGIDVMQEK